MFWSEAARRAKGSWGALIVRATVLPSATRQRGRKRQRAQRVDQVVARSFLQEGSLFVACGLYKLRGP
jgi:hypothetical protein